MPRSLPAFLSFMKQKESLLERFLLSHKMKLPFFKSVNEKTTELGSKKTKSRIWITKILYNNVLNKHVGVFWKSCYKYSARQLLEFKASG